MTFKISDLPTAWPISGLTKMPSQLGAIHAGNQILALHLFRIIQMCPFQACYYYERFKRTFSDAFTNCQNLNSELVSIHDEYEHQFLLGLMHDADLIYYPSWIGLSDLITRGTFEWSDGSVNNHVDSR